MRYDVDFWLASDGFLPNQLQVAVDGVPLLALDDILVQPYAARHASFVATSGSSVLQFGFRNDSGLLHLDDVRVAAIPEPAINLLMARRARRPGAARPPARPERTPMNFDLVKRIGALLAGTCSSAAAAAAVQRPLVDTASTEAAAEAARVRPPR